jgi:predicted small lipoprotein YifL
MKKLLAVLMVLSVFTLAACGNKAPEGMDQEFYEVAKAAFIEIDDDTLELEAPDADDIANYQAVVPTAVSDIEKQVVENLKVLVTYNPDVIKEGATQDDWEPYIKARQNLRKLLQTTDKEVPAFKIDENKVKN